MSAYSSYVEEVSSREKEGLQPKPIESADLTAEIIAQIKDTGHKDREDSLKYFIYNTLPGTTDAAGVKAVFLKEIIVGDATVKEITPTFAFELLSHMKGGPSVEVLLDLALGDNAEVAAPAAEVLKTQVFLYEADMESLESAFKAGNSQAKEILESYARAEFFTALPDVEEEIQVVAYIAGVGDISTDLLSPGKEAHSRADRQLHGESLMDKASQQEIVKLKEQHPDKRVMLIAEKGTMGVGSSRMSGVNNVALWTGIQASPNVVVDAEGDPELEQVYAVDTGTVLTINTKDKKLYNGTTELADISPALTKQKLEFIKAGGSYAVVFGKKLQTFASKALGIPVTPVYAAAREVTNEGQGLTAVEKIFNRNAVGVEEGKVLYAGSDMRVEVNIVGSQDTTGSMTAQELEAMAATVISPIVDGGYQSGCHTASVWDKKAQENVPKLMSFMSRFGLITGRDPKGKYHAMTDVIHKVLNDITVDEWSVIVGGDSHTRMSKGIAFGADSGTVALALATGELSMQIPESVKVTFKGEMKPYMDFRDVVHATQLQMLDQFGDNVFQSRVIEVHLGTLLADQAFTFTDWTAEMKAKASICISQDDKLIESLEIARSRMQIMVEKGMENETKVLANLIGIADKRIKDIKSGAAPALKPDDNAVYAAEVVVDLDLIDEPMIADPDVNNDDVSRRYTHDVIRELSYYKGTKEVDLGFVGSCMVHKGDLKIIAQMFRNLESDHGGIEFKAPLVVAAPTYNIIDELKEEGDWEVLQKYSGFEFNDDAPKQNARVEYENLMYLERPGCNLCMGNQEKAEKGDTVMATSTRLFQGRVVEDSERKKGESLLASTPVVVLSAILGRTPKLDEYKEAVEGIKLTDFKPPEDEMSIEPSGIPGIGLRVEGTPGASPS